MGVKVFRLLVLTFLLVPAGVQASGSFLGVSAAPDVPSNLVARVAQFVTEQTGLPTRPLTALDTDGRGLEALVEGMAAVCNRPDAWALIGLVRVIPGESRHAEIDVKRKAGVVNLGAFWVDNEDLMARRLEKQMMRGIGLLANMPACPNPHCCLHTYDNLETLDKMGRTFCPPCMIKQRKQAVAEGLIPAGRSLCPLRKP